jgi:hypothetical protein
VTRLGLLKIQIFLQHIDILVNLHRNSDQKISEFVHIEVFAIKYWIIAGIEAMVNWVESIQNGIHCRAGLFSRAIIIQVCVRPRWLEVACVSILKTVQARSSAYIASSPSFDF